MTPDIYPARAQTREDRTATKREYIRAHVGKLTLETIGEHLGISESAVYRHASAMGIDTHNERTKRLVGLREEVRLLLFDGGYTEQELLRAFGARCR